MLSQELSKKDRIEIVSSLMLATMLSALDLLIIATAVTDIASDLGNVSQTSWLFSSYLLGVGVVMPVWGKLGDVYGRGRIYIAAILLFLAASLAAGFAFSMIMLVFARLIQGVAAGGLLALPHAIIGDIAPPRSRGIYFASITSVWAASAVLGPLVGGTLVDTIGWRWIFFLNIPIGFSAIGLLVLSGTLKKLTIPNNAAAAPKNTTRQNTTGRSDLKVLIRGAALLISGLGALTLAASLVGDIWEPDSIWFIGCLILGAIIMTTFIRTQLKLSNQLIPFKMFNYRVVKTAALTSFFFGLGNFGMAIILPLYAQIVNGVSATLAGLTLAPVAVGVFFASLVVGGLIKRYGHYKLYPILGCVIYIFGVFLLLTMDEGTSRPAAMLFALITGIGNGMIQPVIILAIQNAVTEKELGSATSVATTSRSLGQTIGSAILGAIITTALTSRLTGLGLNADTYLDDPDEIQNLPGSLMTDVISSYHTALDISLVAVAGFVFMALLASLFIPQVSLDAKSSQLSHPD